MLFRSGVVTRDPITNTIITVATNYTNLSTVKTRGVDLDAVYKMTTPYGKFGLGIAGSYIEQFNIEGTDYVGNNGNSSLPRIRGNVSLDWDQGPFSATLRANYIHSYYQQLLAGSFYAQQDPRFQSGVYSEKIGSRTTLDLYGAYEFNNKLKISGSVLNLANSKPPYDPGASSTFLYDFSQYDVRGRAYRANLTYKFR